MSTRLYIVRDMEAAEDTQACRLIEATNPAAAMRYVAASRYECEVASAKTVATLMGDGVTVERAKAEPETAA